MAQYTHVLFYVDPFNVIFVEYIPSDIFISNQRLFQRHWFNGVVCLFVWLVELAHMQPDRAFRQ